MKTLLKQYKLVLGARNALFPYLAAIPFAKLHQPIENFSNKSVCYLLNHIAITYLSWLNEFAMNIPLVMTDGSDWQSMDDVLAAYKEVDECVITFLATFEDEDEKITEFKKRQDIALTLSVLQLFTHVITHEFHHKGVVLNMTRQLGYTPVDTDIIRT